MQIGMCKSALPIASYDNGRMPRAKQHGVQQCIAHTTKERTATATTAPPAPEPLFTYRQLVGVGGPGDEPQQLLRHAAPKRTFGSEQRQDVIAQAEPHLGPEDRDRARAGAVAARDALGQNLADQVEVPTSPRFGRYRSCFCDWGGGGGSPYGCCGGPEKKQKKKDKERKKLTSSRWCNVRFAFWRRHCCARIMTTHWFSSWLTTGATAAVTVPSEQTVLAGTVCFTL